MYSLNSDSPEFFEHVADQIELIAVDFNCVLNNSLIKNRGRPQHGNKKSQIFHNGWIDEFHLLDIWRHQNPTL